MSGLERASKNFILNLKKKKKEDKSLLFLDNAKIIKDALKNKTIKIEVVLTTLTEFDSVKNLLGVELKESQVLRIDQQTIDQLSDTKTPQKVLCIAYYTQDIVKTPKTNFLVLDGLQDPGNVGTLIRTAKACGFESVFLVGCVHVTNSKLIRSSAGAVFGSDIYELSHAKFLSFAKENNLKLICADMDGENIFEFADKLQNKNTSFLGVVVGNEGNGVCEEIETLCFKKVKIPMREGIESLNAGVSGSIIMYEINKKILK